MSGTVYGLGIGPGDPELITLKALRILQASPVLAYPALEDGVSLARSIVAPHITHAPDELAIRIEMGKDANPVYDRAAEEIAARASEGNDVAVLCEGDPFFYGSYMYLFGRLAEKGYPVRTVPGVSSMTACAAELGAPLAARNDILKVLPGPLDSDALRAEIAGGDALAIIKLGRHFKRIRTLLEEADLLDRARYIERATLDTQRVLPVAEIPADEKIPYFSMILVHKRGEAWR